MQSSRPCKKTEACLHCDNSKFKALFRGNVPLECKLQFVLKYVNVFGRIYSRTLGNISSGESRKARTVGATGRLRWSVRNGQGGRFKDSDP